MQASIVQGNPRVKQLALVIAPLLTLATGCSNIEPASDAVTETSYLDQTPPGMTPALFAPGIVSTDNLEIEGVFTPDMTQFYFVRQVLGVAPKLYLYQLENGEWTESMFGDRTGEVFFSSDGQTMFLGNQYRERTETGWSDPKSLGSDFEQYPVMRLTASDAGTYVFDEREEYGILRYSQLIDGKRSKPKPFNEEINTGKFTAHPFIAPDESYLIWDSEREGGYGESDLYISFRQDDGSWGKAINMGPEVNSEREDAYGTLTPDGKYFFFHRIDLSVPMASIYWVDAKIIDELRASQ